MAWSGNFARVKPIVQFYARGGYRGDALLERLVERMNGNWWAQRDDGGAEFGWSPELHPRNKDGRFANEDLAGITDEVLERASAFLMKPITRESLARLVGAMPGVKVTASWNSRTPHQLEVNFEDKSREIEGARTVRRGPPPSIRNDGFESYGKTAGIGTAMLSIQVAEAVRVGGISHIETHAVGNGDGTMRPKDKTFNETLGYYAWAKMGYNGRIENHIQLEHPYDNAKTIHELMAMPGGAEEWYKNGGHFHGFFDLKQGSRALAILKAYAAKKGMGHLATFENADLVPGAILSAEDDEILDDIWGEIQRHGWIAIGVTGGQPDMSVAPVGEPAQFEYNPNEKRGEHGHWVTDDALPATTKEDQELAGTFPKTVPEPYRHEDLKAITDEHLHNISMMLGVGVDREQLARLVGAQPGGKIGVEDYGTKKPTGQRFFTIALHDDAKGYDGARTIYSGPPPYIHNDIFRVDGGKEGGKQTAGIGAKMLATQVQQAVRIGVFSHIETHAAGLGDGTMDKREHGEFLGYYAWARMGYDGAIPKSSDPDDRNWDNARLDFPFSKANTIHELMAMKGGPEEWYKHGVAWSAKFDLSEDSKSRKILRAYADAKGLASHANFSGTPMDLQGQAIITPDDEAILERIWNKVAEDGWDALDSATFHGGGNPNHDAKGLFAPAPEVPTTRGTEAISRPALVAHIPEVWESGPYSDIPVVNVSTPRREGLKTLDVDHVINLRGSANLVQIVTLSDGSSAIWKPESGEDHSLRANISGRYFAREAAASDVAHVLGLSHLAPATVTREIRGERGSLQDFIGAARTAIENSPSRYFDGPEDMLRVAAFDFLIGNTDRHVRNWMVSNRDPAKLTLIDNGLSFPDKPGQAPSTRFLEEVDDKDMKIPAEARTWLGKKNEIIGVLKSHGLMRSEIAETVSRLEMLSQAADFRKMNEMATNKGYSIG